MENVVKDLKSIWKLDKINKVIYFALLAFSTLLSISIPLIMVNFIDIINKAVSMSSLMRSVLLYFMLMLIRGLAYSVFGYYSSMKEFEFTQLLKNRVLDRLFSKDGKFFSEEKAGDLLLVVEDDTAKIAEFIYRVYGVIASFVQAFAVLGVLFYYDWQLSLILFLMIPVTLVIQRYFGEKLRSMAFENRKDYGNVSALTEEFVSNALAMIMYGYHSNFMRKYDASVEHLSKSFKKLTVTNQLSNQTLQLVTTIGLILVTGYGGFQVFDQWISIGVLVIFLQHCSNFIIPFENLVLLKVRFNMITPSLKRVGFILGVDDKNDAKREIKKITDIRMKSVTFGYTQDKDILSNVNLEFDQNKKYLICGESGIGKTTIINLIMGLWGVSKGKIYVNDELIDNIDLESYRERIAIVSQKTFFLHDTVYNNLSNGMNISEEKVWNSIKRVGLYDLVNGFEDGIHTVLGDDGMTISGGQRQRLAIARSMLKESDVVIFDEPTSALDSRTEQLIVEMISSIEDKMIIVVSHSSCFVDCVDHIYRIG